MTFKIEKANLARAINDCQPTLHDNLTLNPLKDWNLIPHFRYYKT